MKDSFIARIHVCGLLLGLCLFLAPVASTAQSDWLDNNRIWDISSENPNVNTRSGEHFKIAWGNGVAGTPGIDGVPVTEELVQGNLQMLEQLWRVIHTAPPIGLGIHIPRTSVIPEYMSEVPYRANLVMNNTGIWEGGAWGSCDEWGFPLFALPPSYLRFDPPSGATPHEYGHTVLINMGGFDNTPYDGAWHEATANWIQLQLLNSYPGVGATIINHACSLPHGRTYYDAWPIWEAIREDPKYGPSFFNKLWTQALGDAKKPGGGEYIFDAMVRLHPTGEPDPYNAIKDLLGRTAARSVTWDFQRGQHFRTQCPITSDFFNDMYRRGYSELEKRPGSDTWYRVPWQDAPSQGGLDVIPIALNGKTGGGYNVSINFQPLWDGTRGADWRATLVAVNDNGEPRYSRMWNGGINSMTLSSDENKLFLVVAATPDFMGFGIGTGYTLRGPELQPQAFEIAFVDTLAGPYESKPTIDHANMHQHSNGGGWVSNSATVNASAYVGPNAMVLGTASVLNSARIEDYAVVQDSAQVRDNAIVSGHALVRDSAQVYGYAKVRDWATVRNSAKIYENGKVLERATADNAIIHENGLIKGYTYDWAETRGYAIKDGDCANGANIDHQVLLCWVWGTDQNYADKLPDINWRYCEYTFDTFSPIYAMDTMGITHGYLMGDAPIVNDADINRGNVLSLNGVDQYVELRKDVCDFKDVTYAIWFKWDGSADKYVWSMGDGAGKYMTLTPKDSTGQLKFAISKTGAAGEQTLTAPAAQANTWTHVAVVFSGNAGRLYVNGVQAAQKTMFPLNPDDVMGANTATTGNCNYLGRGSAGGFLNGRIDNFVTYQRALDAYEIAAMMPEVGGLRADYYNGLAFNSLLMSRLDSTVDFNWQTGSPSASIPSDKFTVRWTGKIQPRYTGTYTFYVTTTDEGIRMWVNGVQIINQWSVAAPAEKSGTIDLTAGQKYDIKIEYQEYLGSASCKLEWASASQAREIVPDTCLWPDGVAPPPVYEKVPPSPSPARFLQVPTAVDENTITMSSVRGTDASGFVEYYFTCTSGGGHDSGWISSSKYTDCALTPGTTYSYTVKMRDKYGNTTNQPTALSATTLPDSGAPVANPADWAARPVGISDTAITMTAAKASCSGNLVEYKFTRTSPPFPQSASNWQSSPTWTDTNLNPGSSYAYKVQTRNVRGATGTASAAATAIARDDTPPTRWIMGEWEMMPYATTDNCISMTAREVSDTAGVQYYFECTSGNGPDSGWVDGNKWKTTPLPNGLYYYRFKIREKTGRLNETGYSSTEPAKITDYSGYHDYNIGDLKKKGNEVLVGFQGIVTGVFADGFYMQSPDRVGGIKVITKAPLDASYQGRLITVTGVMKTRNGERVILAQAYN